MNGQVSWNTLYHKSRLLLRRRPPETWSARQLNGIRERIAILLDSQLSRDRAPLRLALSVTLNKQNNRRMHSLPKSARTS